MSSLISSASRMRRGNMARCHPRPSNLPCPAISYFLPPFTSLGLLICEHPTSTPVLSELTHHPRFSRRLSHESATVSCSFPSTSSFRPRPSHLHSDFLSSPSIRSVDLPTLPPPLYHPPLRRIPPVLLKASDSDLAFALKPSCVRCLSSSIWVVLLVRFLAFSLESLLTRF